MHVFLEVFVLNKLIGANNTQCILILLFVIIFVLVIALLTGVIIFVSFPRSAVIVLKGLTTTSFNGLTDLVAIFMEMKLKFWNDM